MTTLMWSYTELTHLIPMHHLKRTTQVCNNTNTINGRL